MDELSQLQADSLFIANPLALRAAFTAYGQRWAAYAEQRTRKLLADRLRYRWRKRQAKRAERRKHASGA